MLKLDIIIGCLQLLSTFNVCVSVDAFVCLCKCTEARGGQSVICSGTLHLIPMRQGLSLTLELGEQLASPAVLSLCPAGF